MSVMTVILLASAFPFNDIRLLILISEGNDRWLLISFSDAVVRTWPTLHWNYHSSVFFIEISLVLFWTYSLWPIRYSFYAIPDYYSDRYDPTLAMTFIIDCVDEWQWRWHCYNLQLLFRWLVMWYIVDRKEARWLADVSRYERLAYSKWRICWYRLIRLTYDWLPTTDIYNSVYYFNSTMTIVRWSPIDDVFRRKYSACWAAYSSLTIVFCYLVSIQHSSSIQYSTWQLALIFCDDMTFPNYGSPPFGTGNSPYIDRHCWPIRYEQPVTIELEDDTDYCKLTLFQLMTGYSIPRYSGDCDRLTWRWPDDYDHWKTVPDGDDIDPVLMMTFGDTVRTDYFVAWNRYDIGWRKYSSIDTFFDYILFYCCDDKWRPSDDTLAEGILVWSIDSASGSLWLTIEGRNTSFGDGIPDIPWHSLQCTWL